LTDVTGFGLLGHLVEMCEGSGLSAEVDFDSVPVIKNVKDYLAQNAVPGGTKRNWNSYGHKVYLNQGLSSDAINILADPQTNGGLLVAVSIEEAGRVQNLLKSAGLESGIIGKMGVLKDHFVVVK
jgi:selenide,water dikinase